MEPVTLATDRLLLRPFGPADADEVLRACQNADIQRWTTVPSPYERRHAEGFVSEISPNGWRDETLFNFGTFTKDRGELVSSVGLVGVGGLRTEGRTAEIGFWTAKEQRGHGYTVEAVLAVARWTFTALGADRLEWYAEVGNEGSRAVAVKAGFTMEGTLRSRLVHRGTRRDAWTGSLLPSDLSLPGRTPYVPSPRQGRGALR
ncbi:GNAT family N-acetyltransferase [Wenjunlia tyrosinilytica]|uniref:Acetyltransferase n=1 Tax=Wenjunlia tyrosinilytica TaxID=1544741 RepID=A0A917ZXC6_9ACTN|nr:GNAT family N-acetyltransferase [Wenjunlia tyrosinilytica]GGO97357.1 acetyltransferase [Wenjunlia tyrosinilytica]